MFPVNYTIHNEQYNGINFINVIFQTVQRKQWSVLVVEHCQKAIQKHLSLHGRRYTFLIKMFLVAN